LVLLKLMQAQSKVMDGGGCDGQKRVTIAVGSVAYLAAAAELLAPANALDATNADSDSADDDDAETLTGALPTPNHDHYLAQHLQTLNVGENEKLQHQMMCSQTAASSASPARNHGPSKEDHT
jgi:hypothetical protein